ncbi:TetR/AcrR family transcriptional regulator [Chengkuizengella axinellae]|uniref:TetR/AcrR family transcriptional regulator n=1 Tax=Chengkuizengella axinellae TaxID=3064388 RepID=A0ABT9J647_9BACL|nr:TetR/AcrR family transcriptional regulator [Chengkuizengella sp. 2205SS18-9]MDP5276480.1 TetR/AcrR family transcriptional regulator [Chengkuizengella sp. 2205SS18-9]
METEVHTRQRILIAAEELFSKKGFEKVTIREIGKKANCSHATIYFHFKDKKNILEKLAVTPMKTLLFELKEIVYNKEISSQEKLLQISRMHVEFGLSNVYLYKQFFSTGFKTDYSDVFGEEWDQFRFEMFNVLFNEFFPNHFKSRDDKELKMNCRLLHYQLHGIIVVHIANGKYFLKEKGELLPLIEQAVHNFMLTSESL